MRSLETDQAIAALVDLREVQALDRLQIVERLARRRGAVRDQHGRLAAEQAGEALELLRRGLWAVDERSGRWNLVRDPDPDLELGWLLG